MADYNQNPFASTHSLDANPFDDPAPTQDKTARQRDLEQRERDLQRREQELNQRAEHIRKHGRNNWPPFFPLIFHSIREEIPEASRPLINRLYQLWLVLLATLIINMIACIFFLVAGSSDGGKDLGGSIGYHISALSSRNYHSPLLPHHKLPHHNCPSLLSVVVQTNIQRVYERTGLVLLSALLSFLPSPRVTSYAFSLDIFFFFCGFHLLYSIYMVIGIPSTGSAGLIQTIQMYASGHWAAGILGTVATVGWSVQGLGLAYYYRQIWSHHNTAGHTVDKAKAELASHGAKAYFTRG